MSSAASSGKSATSLSHRAYTTIRTLILKGTYPLGTTLVRGDLAKQFGMSTVPVAEALARLEAEGLVENRPRVGTIVSVPTPAQIRGQWVVREALEVQAARMFALRANSEDRHTLWRLAEEFDLDQERIGRQTDVDPEALFEHRCRHMRLHRHIAESAGQPELRKAIEMNHVLLFHWMHNRKLYGGSPMPSRWHRDLAEVLCRGTAEEAAEAMRRHVNDRLEVLMRNLEAFLTINLDRMGSVLSPQAAP
ncbi:MAG: GntR family transcriptional regulator [Rhodospirillales bacterium]